MYGKLIRGLCLFLGASTIHLLAVDLSKATVIAPDELRGPERKAVEMLVDEVAARTQGLRWTVASSGANPAIRIQRASGPAEGYSIQTDAAGVTISGNDPRGVLFGIGHLLRSLEYQRRKVELAAPLNVTTAPKYPLRGHQLGYRPKTNSYDAWTPAMWEQYIRDLAIFGTNAIELIPPRSDDDDDSPHFPLPPMQMMTEMSRIADSYGLDVWVWYPAMDKDYGDPRTVDSALKEWEEVFRKLPRIDAVFVPGGDPGHTQPKHLMALLEKQTAVLRKHHPKATMWVSPQSFSAEWMEEFFGILKKEPAWLGGVVFGPQQRTSVQELRDECRSATVSASIRILRTACDPNIRYRTGTSLTRSLCNANLSIRAPRMRRRSFGCCNRYSRLVF